MFSAYDGVHEYAVTPSVPDAEEPPTEGDPVLASSIRWEMDSSYVSRSEFSDLPSAIKLTMRKPGKTIITMFAKHIRGPAFRQTAALTITQASPEEWDIGNERYNQEPVVPFPDAFVDSDAGTCDLPDELSFPSDAACVSCHADSEPSSMSVAVTPTQLAGYSNSDLLQIITAGAKPAGGAFNSDYFRKLDNPDARYRALHSFELSDEEKRGIVVKLRSLAPRVFLQPR